MLPAEVTVKDRINLREIPLNALKQRTLGVLSALLNKKKIFVSEDGYHRDWRGLFQALKLEHYYIEQLEAHANPTQRLFELWKETASRENKTLNLLELQHILGIIDRWDVVDDSDELFQKDAEQFLVNKEKTKNQSSLEVMQNQSQLVSDFPVPESDIITKDDTVLEKQIYDAFVLFADADVEFAAKIVTRMEERGLKLCLKDRDVLAGITFEHDVIIRLISERCHRLVVVFSKEFLKSPLNEFVITYAQALQIEQKQRKILPCVYERIELPPALKFTFILDYKRAQNLYNYWDKLEDSIRVRKHPPAVEPRELVAPSAPVMPIPDIRIDSVDSVPTKEFDDACCSSANSTVDAAAGQSPQVIKKSQSAWDISQAWNRMLSSSSSSNKKSSSTSELNVDEPATPERKERSSSSKWMSKLGLGKSGSSSTSRSKEKSAEKKTKRNKLAVAQ